MCTAPEGKVARNTAALIETMLKDINRDDILELSITGYQQCGEWEGEIIMPIISLKLKEK